jgi:hypothetical protein
MGYNKAYGEGVEVMEECVKPIYVHIYAEGHLIDYPNIPVYLGMYNGSYLVINSVTRYPISVAEKEVVALVFARARKLRETRKAIISRILKVDTDLWNWGDIFLVESNDGMNDKPPPLERGKNLNISSENTKTELPAGQLLGHEEREPISPAIPAGEERSSTHKRGVTSETSGNPYPLGRGGGQGIYPINELQNPFKLKPFKQMLSRLPNFYSNEECVIAFDRCEKFPLYVNLELCIYDGFHFFVLKQFKDGLVYITQSPRTFTKNGG